MVVGCLSLVLLAAPAPAGDWTTGWSGFGQLFHRVERDRPDDVLRVNEDLSLDEDGYLTPRVDEDATLGFVAVTGWAERGDWLRMFGTLDSGTVRHADSELTFDGRPASEAEPGLLRQAWAELHLGPVVAGAGKRNLRVGGGLLYDEYATGLAVAVQTDDLRLESGVWLLGRALLPERGPMVEGRLSWAVDLTNEVYVYGAVITDDAEAAEEFTQAFIDVTVLTSAISQRPGGGAVILAVDECAKLTGEARPWNVGAGADLLFGGNSVHLAAALGRGYGRVEIEPDFGAPGCSELLRAILERARTQLDFRGADTELESFALDGTWRTRVNEWLYPGAAFTDGTGTLGAYLAAAPYLPRSALFFGAGLGTGFETRSATVAGVLGRGVLAPALTLLLVPHDRVEVDLRAVWLEADQDGPFSSDRTYGQEYDVTLRWEVVDSVSLEAEYDVMDIGGFYPEKGSWWRFTAGAAVIFPP